jgi:hypothetical protein
MLILIRMAGVLNAEEIGENTPASILSRTRKKKVKKIINILNKIY